MIVICHPIATFIRPVSSVRLYCPTEYGSIINKWIDKTSESVFFNDMLHRDIFFPFPMGQSWEIHELLIAKYFCAKRWIVVFTEFNIMAAKTAHSVASLFCHDIEAVSHFFYILIHNHLK